MPRVGWPDYAATELALFARELTQAEPPAIRVEVWNGNNTVTVTWPASEASSCGAWLSEWLR